MQGIKLLEYTPIFMGKCSNIELPTRFCLSFGSLGRVSSESPSVKISTATRGDLFGS